MSGSGWVLNLAEQQDGLRSSTEMLMSTGINSGTLLRVGMSNNHFHMLPQWVTRTHQPNWTFREIISIFIEKICLGFTTLAKKRQRTLSLTKNLSQAFSNIPDQSNDIPLYFVKFPLSHAPFQKESRVLNCFMVPLHPSWNNQEAIDKASAPASSVNRTWEELLAVIPKHACAQI